MNNLNNMQVSAYEQNRNNGKGIFYGVIAVATLIVAIIGATFAYFTAQARGDVNSVNTTSATVSINYNEGRNIQATNLIPASSEAVAKAYKNPTAKEYNENPSNGVICSYDEATDTYIGDGCKNKGDIGTKCVDDNGYFVCSWYEFSVTNQSNASQAVSAYMTIDNNDFMSLDNESLVGLGATVNEDGNYVGASRAIYDAKAGNVNNNLALKFMTVRSSDIIDVDATVCNEQHSSSDNLVDSTDFCNNNKSTYDVGFSKSLSGITDYEAVSDYTSSFYTDFSTGRKYYNYNTVGVRQSMGRKGSTQDIFKKEVIPNAPIDVTGDVRQDCDVNGNVGKGNLSCGTTRTFYVLIWLEENRYADKYVVNDVEYEAQNIDQGKTYAATITVQSTVSGNN